MKKLKILVVDDDAIARDTLVGLLTGHDVEEAADRAQAERELGGSRFDICFIDLQLGKCDDFSGLKVIPTAKAKGTYSVVMSGHDDDEIIDRAYEAGCDDYFCKGNETSNVQGVLGKYLRRTSGDESERIFSEEFITDDETTRAEISQALKYAPTELPILILGPSGSGKTKLAEILHHHSHREGPFVAINCAAYPEDLLEAELFGHKKGAFTGAAEERKGKLLQADKGTLFLDEIGSMSPKMQAKLLKAIEEKTFYPVGSDKPQKSEFRVMSATLEDLKRLIAEDRMRFDLFQRISGVSVHLPPLSRRPGDIMPMVRFFTKGKRRLSFTQDGKDYLLGHFWPGNARELKRLVELLSSAGEGRMGSDDVAKYLAMTGGGAEAEALTTEKHYQFARKHGLQEFLDRCTAEIVRRNLKENDGKKTHTLRDLKISSRLLYSTIRGTLPGESSDETRN